MAKRWAPAFSAHFYVVLSRRLAPRATVEESLYAMHVVESWTHHFLVTLVKSEGTPLCSWVFGGIKAEAFLLDCQFSGGNAILIVIGTFFVDSTRSFAPPKVKRALVGAAGEAMLRAMDFDVNTTISAQVCFVQSLFAPLPVFDRHSDRHVCCSSDTPVALPIFFVQCLMAPSWRNCVQVFCDSSDTQIPLTSVKS